MEMSSKPQYRFSCQPCKKRKTKCDRIDPCTSCTLRKTTQFCYNGKGEPAYAQIDPASAALALKNAQRVPVTTSGGPALSVAQGYGLPAGLQDAESQSNLPPNSGWMRSPASLLNYQVQAKQQAPPAAQLSSKGSSPRSLPSAVNFSTSDGSSPAIVGPSGVINDIQSINDATNPLSDHNAYAAFDPDVIGTAVAAVHPSSLEWSVSPNSNGIVETGTKRVREENEKEARAIREEEDAAAQRLASLKAQLETLKGTVASMEALIAASTPSSGTAGPGGNVAARIDSSVLALEGESEAFLGGRIFDATGTSYAATLAIPELSWADLAGSLPSQEDCSRYLQYFLDELQYYSPIIHRASLEQRWAELVHNRLVTRNEAAILVISFAITGLLTPASAPWLQEVSVNPRDHHAEWFKYAFRILDQGRDALSNEDNSFDRVLVDSMALAYCSYAGMHDLSFSMTGRAVRRAQCLHLFDDTHRAWNKLSDVQREYRRRCAHQLLIVDRWQSFHFRRDFAIDPAHFNVEEPTYDPDECFDLETGDRKPDKPPSPISKHTRRIEFGQYLLQTCRFLDDMRNIRPADRYARAEGLDNLLDKNLNSSLASVGLTATDLRRSWSTSEPDSNLKRLGVAVMWFSSAYYVRCMLFRPFLEDEDAPREVRFKALDHARRLLECIPLVLTLSKSTIPFSPAWTSIHLLAASTTFAVPFLMATPLSPEQDGNATINTPWPSEHLSYFSDQIFETLSVLDHFDSAGNYAAKICRQLLFGLCTSRKELQERFALHRQKLHNKAMQDATTNHLWMGPLQQALAQPLPDSSQIGNMLNMPTFLDTLIMDPDEWYQLTAGLGLE